MSVNRWVVLMLLLGSLGGACARPPQSPFRIESWPARLPRGICLVEVGRSGNGNRCTGAVINGAAGLAYAVTAKHCFDLHSGTVDRASVLLPEKTAGHFGWRRYPAIGALMPSGPATRVVAEDDDILWRQDWSIVEFFHPDVPSSIPLLPDSPVRRPKPGDAVALESFFDEQYDTFYPHSHEFHWRQEAETILQPGHSGAPIVWRGQLIALFSGFRETQKLLFFRSRKQSFTAIETLRVQAARCGFAIDAHEFAVPFESKPGCSVLRLSGRDETRPAEE